MEASKRKFLLSEYLFPLLEAVGLSCGLFFALVASTIGATSGCIWESDCITVVGSEIGSLWGIKLAWIGVGAMVLLLVLAVWSASDTKTGSKYSIYYIGAHLVALSSIVLQIYSRMTLHAFCSTCFLFSVSNVLLVISLRLQMGFGGLIVRGVDLLAKQFILVLVLILVLRSVFMSDNVALDFASREAVKSVLPSRLVPLSQQSSDSSSIVIFADPNCPHTQEILPKVLKKLKGEMQYKCCVHWVTRSLEGQKLAHILPRTLNGESDFEVVDSFLSDARDGHGTFERAAQLMKLGRNTLDRALAPWSPESHRVLTDIELAKACTLRSVPAFILIRPGTNPEPISTRGLLHLLENP